MDTNSYTLKDLLGLVQLIKEDQLRLGDDNAKDLLLCLEARVAYYQRLFKCVTHYSAREECRLSPSTMLRPFLAAIAKDMSEEVLAGMEELEVKNAEEEA